jgi:hypothetical protein
MSGNATMSGGMNLLRRSCLNSFSSKYLSIALLQPNLESL